LKDEEKGKQEKAYTESTEFAEKNKGKAGRPRGLPAFLFGREVGKNLTPEGVSYRN